MAGQPSIPPWLVFNVVKLEVFEPVGAIDPAPIVPLNKPFTLKATFTGRGIIWGWLKSLGVKWEVQFSAEGIGGDAGEFDYGPETGALEVGMDTYVAEFKVTDGIAKAGVYDFACVVVFPDCPGMTGNVKGLSIQIY